MTLIYPEPNPITFPIIKVQPTNNPNTIPLSINLPSHVQPDNPDPNSIRELYATEVDDDIESQKLPTGEELMSGPIKTGVVTRRDKEIAFVIDNIKNRLGAIRAEEGFEVKNVMYFSLTLISVLIGLTLLMYGLHETYIFDKFDKRNMVAIVFAGIFLSPSLCFLIYCFMPQKKERMKRRKIHSEKKERKTPNLFNQLVEDAKKATEPPPRKIKVTAKFRKKDYIIVASTWREFCEDLEDLTKLPIERQLIRHFDNDLVIDLKKKLDQDYGLDNGAILHIYNRGGYFTQDAPIKRQYEDILSQAGVSTGSTSETPRPSSKENRPSSSSKGNRPSSSSKNNRPSSSSILKKDRNDSFNNDSRNNSKQKVSWKSS